MTHSPAEYHIVQQFTIRSTEQSVAYDLNCFFCHNRATIYNKFCIVADQRASYLFGKSPKMCGRKIYVICLVQLFRQSCFNAPANTSYSFTLLRIILWSLQYCKYGLILFRRRLVSSLFFFETPKYHTDDHI